MGSRPNPNIWQLQSQGNIKGIIEALDTQNSTIRRRAIGALRALDAKESIPHLQLLYKREFNPEIRAYIETTLEHLNRDTDKAEVDTAEDQKQELLRQLKSDEHDKVLKAIEKFGELNDQTVVEDIVVIFRTTTYPVKVRLAAAETLLKLKSALASISLLGALRKDDWQVRRNAAAVLGQLQADWCVDPLIDVMMTDRNPVVRKTAAAALYRIKTPSALAALRKSEFYPRQPSAPDVRKTEVMQQMIMPSPPPPPPTLPEEPKVVEDTPAPVNAKPEPPVASTPAPKIEEPALEDESTQPILPDLNSLPQPAWLRKKRPKINRSDNP